MRCAGTPLCCLIITNQVDKRTPDCTQRRTELHLPPALVGDTMRHKHAQAVLVGNSRTRTRTPRSRSTNCKGRRINGPGNMGAKDPPVWPTRSRPGSLAPWGNEGGDHCGTRGPLVPPSHASRASVGWLDRRLPWTPTSTPTRDHHANTGSPTAAVRIGMRLAEGLTTQLEGLATGIQWDTAPSPGPAPETPFGPIQVESGPRGATRSET